MSRLIRCPLGLLICPPRGIVLLNAAILSASACSAGSGCLRLLAMLVLVRITRIFMLSLWSRPAVGSLITLGGSGVGNWQPTMNLLCSLISSSWIALNRLLRRFQSMSLKILILPGRLGFLSFRSSLKRLVMSVVFALLGVGVTLAGLWVLSTLMQIH